MNIEYRTMQPEDHQAVIKLWTDSQGVDLTRSDNPAEFKRFLDRNPGFSFVALHGEKLVGAVLCGHDGRRGFLHHLSVASAYQRKGLGTVLVDRCLAALKATDIEKCHLFIRRDNTEGLQFWTDTGWTERTTLTMASRTLDETDSIENPNSC